MPARPGPAYVSGPPDRGPRRWRTTPRARPSPRGRNRHLRVGSPAVASRRALSATVRAGTLLGASAGRRVWALLRAPVSGLTASRRWIRRLAVARAGRNAVTLAGLTVSGGRPIAVVRAWVPVARPRLAVARLALVLRVLAIRRLTVGLSRLAIARLAVARCGLRDGRRLVFLGVVASVRLRAQRDLDRRTVARRPLAEPGKRVVRRPLAHRREDAVEVLLA